MRLTLAERLTWDRANAFLNKLPFRGRGLFFVAGSIVGGGGLAGYALRRRSQDAARPTEDRDDSTATTTAASHTVTPIFGTGKQRTWWGWRPVELKVVDSAGILLIDPTPLHQAGAAVRSGGRRATAFPLAGANVTEIAAKKQIKLETNYGEIEYLQLSTDEDLRDWSCALQRSSRDAMVDSRRVVDVSYPRHWDAPHDQFRLIRLNKKSDEYRKAAKLAITQQFKQGKGKTPFVKGKIKVTGVWRVQAPRLWEAYRMRRAIIAAENNGDANEKWLWHGTNVPDLITRKGLDPRVCSLNGLFGGGVYFADTSTKSVRYTGASGKGDRGRLLLCRVALGRQMVKYMPSPNIRRPPEPFPLYPSQIVAWLRDEHFHSLFAPSGYPGSFLLMNEYIVYHCNQAVPDYVVDFELV